MSVDIWKIEKEIKQDLKKLLKQVDEKEAKLYIDMNKQVNKVAPLYWEKIEEKKMAGDKKSRDMTPKLPLSDNQIHLVDMKKKSFAQNDRQKYGLTNEQVRKIKNKENCEDSNYENGSNVTNAMHAKDSQKKVEQTLSPPTEVKKKKQNKVQNQVEEKVSVRKVINAKTGKIIEIRKVTPEKGSSNLEDKNVRDTKTGKIIEIRKVTPEKGSSNLKDKNVRDTKTGKIIEIRKVTPEKGSSNLEDKNVRKVPKYTDAGLNKLRRWKRKGQVDPIIEEPEPEPEPIVEEPDPRNNKKGTRVKPFSFEVREKEFLKKKEMLAKMGGERIYEMKKWARSPEVLKKKPFSILTTKRYILPDLCKIKFKTEERMKKRPKFDDIVEQKQKSLKEQQLMKNMAELKELRKSLVHSPTPIPENVMRLLNEAKKVKSDDSSQVSGSDEDLFSDLEYTDVEDHYYTYAGSALMLVESEHRLNPADELKYMVTAIGESAEESNLKIQSENTSNDDNSDEEKAMLSLEKYEAEKPMETEDSKSTRAEDDSLNGDIDESSDTPSSVKPTTKLTAYDFLMSAFRKK